MQNISSETREVLHVQFPKRTESKSWLASVDVSTNFRSSLLRVADTESEHVLPREHVAIVRNPKEKNQRVDKAFHRRESVERIVAGTDGTVDGYEKGIFSTRAFRQSVNCRCQYPWYRIMYTETRDNCCEV